MVTKSFLTSAPSLRGRRGKIYIRVSMTRGRDELYSPEMQELSARQKAAQEGVEVLDVVFDLDRSGRDFAKRKIAQMIEEVRSGEYAVVLLWKWSRFGRNLRHSLNNLHELEQAGGVAVSATEPGDSVTTMGRFSRNQMLSVAELQSDMIGDGWRDVHNYRLSVGLPHNGGERFGYIYKDKEYFPEPIRGDAVAEAFERYVDGEPMRSIALDMAEAGIRAWNGDILDSRRWMQILDTGFAAGLIRKKKPGAQGKSIEHWEWFPGAQKALIEPDLWGAYLEKRRGSKKNNYKARYSLSGLLLCARCMKFRMTATKTSKGERAFRCSGILTKECAGVTVYLRTVEPAVLEWVLKKAKGDENIEKKARAEAARDKQDSEIYGLQRKIEDIDKRLSRLLDLYEDGDLDKKEYQKRKAERETDRSKYQQRLTELDAGKVTRPLPQKFYKDLADAWPKLSDDRKRQALRQVIEYVIVRPRWHDADERFTVVPKFS
ncbi:recombinase family protein [Nonomuraea sp. B19D2]|uniref:recombinase family protein n=1 Tax=Nonomuraea sp. B19D2 TaxID=3159561 RepID=UPI0032DAF28D